MLCLVLLFGNMVLPWIPLALVLIGLIEAMMLGMGMTLSVVNVYFRDTEHFVNISLQLLFYSAPIVYPNASSRRSDVLGMTFRSAIYELNPLVRFVGAFRTFSTTSGFHRSATWAISRLGGGAAGLGLWVFRKLEPLAEEL